MRRSRFVGGPRDGEVHDTPGAHHHVFPVPAAPAALTAAEAIALMALHWEDRPRPKVGKLFYTRRPALENGEFIYDYDRTEQP